MVFQEDLDDAQDLARAPHLEIRARLGDRAAQQQREPGVVRLSADALAGLALLLSRPVAEAGTYLEVRRAGEILRDVEVILKHHFQRFQGLRSLELLRALPSSSKEEERWTA